MTHELAISGGILEAYEFSECWRRVVPCEYAGFEGVKASGTMWWLGTVAKVQSPPQGRLLQGRRFCPSKHASHVPIDAPLYRTILKI